MPVYLEAVHGSTQLQTRSKKIKIKSRAANIFREELPHMKSILVGAPVMAPEEKKTVDINSKFSLHVFDNRA